MSHIEVRLKQQTVLAKFGELALRSNSLDEILTEACRLVGEGLGTDLAKVMELQEGGTILLVRAGIGWNPGVVGKVNVLVSDGTSESYALRSGQPMVSSDIGLETRFTYPPFLIENGVKAVANVLIISGRGKGPFGILQVDSRVPREFDEADVSFLRSYANLVAAAVDRLQIMGELHDGGVQLRRSHDAMELRVAERTRDLTYKAFHDDLTQLGNRALFIKRLATALDRAKREKDFNCAVLFLDLDHFKLVNDSLGHQAGDLLLVEIAHRLETCTRAQDTLGRMGGDEFALLIESFDNLAAVVTIARRIIQTIRMPVWLGKQEIFTSCSIGLVHATQDHQTPEEVLRNADTAMYQAKRSNTTGYAIFTMSMHDAAVEALDLRVDLQRAIDRREFVLHYQPIFRSSTKTLTGYEALIRWQHPTRGLVPPSSFVGVAEESGLIKQIGHWVLIEASTQARIWRDRYPSLDLHLNVNTSADELKDGNFLDRVERILAVTGLDPDRLQLEFTESVFLKYPDVVSKLLRRLQILGLRFALDDFGSGYSSLSYLDQYHIDTIKIDRSFIAGIQTRPRTMAIVEAVISLGHTLDLEVVAEGVETDLQMQMLQRVNCDLVQGYLLARPMSGEAFEAFLGDHCTPLPVFGQ
jgi:diguanylate cyclase (GGDEF)-like protein